MLPPTSLYRDYIRWLQQQDSQAAEKYWRQYLRGFTTPTQLTLPSSRKTEAEYQESQFDFSTELTARLQTISQARHLTMNTIVEGAWTLLLSHYSTQADVLFGAIVSGRPTTLPGVEQMVGLFINTMPVRVKVDPAKSLGKWLEHLQQQQVQQGAFTHSSLVDIQKWSEVPSGQPLFESLMVFQNYPVDKALKDSDASLRVREVQGWNHPLMLSAVLNKEMILTLNYDSSIYDEVAIDHLMSYLRIILEAMAKNGLNQLLGQFSRLTEDEHRQLLLDRNNSDRVVSKLY